MVWPIQGRTMSKSTSSAFRICVTHRGLDDLSHSYWMSKSSQISSMGGHGRKKTLRQFWELEDETKRINGKCGCLQLLFVSELNFPNLQSVIFFYGALFFFYQTIFFQLFHLCWAITPFIKLPRPINYTFLESSGRKLSQGGTMDIWTFIKISRKLTKCKKIFFLHLVVTGMCPGSAHGLSRGYPDCAQSRPRVCSVLNWIDHIVLIWSNSHDTGALGSAKIKQYACCCGCIKALHHIRAPGATSNF